MHLLLIACRHHSVKSSILECILTYDCEVEINEQDTYGNTPAHLLAENGNSKPLDYMLKRCKDLKLDIRNSEGKTLMHYCRASSELTKVSLSRLIS
jgi:hypothetical protein